MHRIEPVLPDLLPVTHRLGPLPEPRGGVRLDPVEMRLHWETTRPASRAGDRRAPRRPLQILVHAAAACAEAPFVAALLDAGCGLLVVMDDPLDQLPESRFPGQVVVLVPVLPHLWGGGEMADLERWRAPSRSVGALLALAPELGAERSLPASVEQAHARGAEFVVAMPLALPPADRHRVYDRAAGDVGDAALEDLLFHSDLAGIGLALERSAAVACRRLGVPDVLPGPSTSAIPASTARGIGIMRQWARRLDLMDGVSSSGWRLRRAARALAASGRDLDELLGDDNLRIVPGFTPWVEAFVRSAWLGGGAPYLEVVERWVAA